MPGNNLRLARSPVAPNRTMTWGASGSLVPAMRAGARRRVGDGLRSVGGHGSDGSTPG